MKASASFRPAGPTDSDSTCEGSPSSSPSWSAPTQAMSSSWRSSPPTGGRRPERGHRPEPRQRIHRPVGLSSAKERQPADAAWASLTERERAVALLAGHALTNQQIAHRLKISPHTVNFHLRQVFKKLSIESRVSLARIVQTRPSVVETTGAR
ncbi:helix-turn-helix transcriptional regulator [Phytohabitans flavus]|uniref:helix-turn-helix domain-containing protein n=1 Tax=Phytohabitans flavus TaxID=1076124 RepID=UPI0036271A26